MFQTKPVPRDALALAAVLLSALLLFLFPILFQDSGTVLTVSTPQGQAAYSLSVDQTVPITANGISLEIVISGGAAYVSASDCPDRVCVNSPKIQKTGETIVCAPAGVRLQVRGGDDGVDFVAG